MLRYTGQEGVLSGDSALYDGYAKKKGWDRHVDRHDRDFDCLWRTAGLGDAISILEIGIGSGAFMDWARDRGHSVVGVDILPDMVNAAAARGHRALLGEFAPAMFAGEAFDLICAFDVLEHMTSDQLVEFLRGSQQALAAGGRYLFRFPDGQSPLSMIHQNADITHKTVLSAPVLEDLAGRIGLKLSRCFTIRPYPSGLVGKLKRWAAYRLQDCLEIVVGLAYTGKRISLAPNIYVILDRA